MERFPADASGSWLVTNEFSSVEVATSPPDAPQLLTIRSRITGRSISLDALELEALTLLSHRSFDALVLATVQSELDGEVGGGPPRPTTDGQRP